MPTVIVTMPPAAARTLAVPCPIPAFRARRPADDPTIPTHVVPSAIVSGAHVGCDPCHSIADADAAWSTEWCAAGRATANRKPGEGAGCHQFFHGSCSIVFDLGSGLHNAA